MRRLLYIICFFSLMMIACSSDDIIEEDNIDNEKIELSFQINSFVKGTKSSTRETSVDEGTIKNLYVFLFPTTSLQTLKTYDISTSTFTGGIWDSENNKVLLNLTQAEAGNRDVYIVANYSPALKLGLDEVTTIEDLQSALESSDSP